MSDALTEHPEFSILAWGLIYASVCTSEDDETTASRLNAEMPTGISSRWEVCDESTFADGTPNPCPCPDQPTTHRHVLFNC